RAGVRLSEEPPPRAAYRAIFRAFNRASDLDGDCGDYGFAAPGLRSAGGAPAERTDRAGAHEASHQVRVLAGQLRPFAFPAPVGGLGGDVAQHADLALRQPSTAQREDHANVPGDSGVV